METPQISRRAKTAGKAKAKQTQDETEATAQGCA
jgi:hypothetical protein